MIDIKLFLEEWRAKIHELKDTTRDLGSWPYLVDEEDSRMEMILNEDALLKIVNLDLLKVLGDWENERFCVPYEWVFLIVTDAIRRFGKEVRK